MSAVATAVSPRGLAGLELESDAHELSWIREVRTSSLQWIAQHGFPTLKDEDWKYTQIKNVLEVPFQVAQPPTSWLPSIGEIDGLAGDLGGTRLVFINGHFAAQLSSLTDLPGGARANSLASALLENATLLEPILADHLPAPRHAFIALNAALSTDGAFIQIPKDTTISAPIHLVFFSDAGASEVVSSPRSVVLAGARSRATIVETYVGNAGVHLTNAVTEVILDEGAQVEHYKIQDEADTAFHFGALHVRPGRDSSFSTQGFALGAAIARHEVWVRLDSEGASVSLNGVYLPKENQHHDNPTLIEHIAPHCTSRQLYKGILGGHGRGVFNGRIVVGHEALGSDATQTNKNLLLSDTAVVDTRPRLEILTDDVRCTHGAAVGQLDEDAVFYLRSRGVPQLEARGVLTYAFAREMVDLIQVGPLRTHVERKVALQLGAGSAEVER